MKVFNPAIKKRRIELQDKNCQKEKELMQKFFVKATKEKPAVKSNESTSMFMAFEVKQDMRMAPLVRLSTERLKSIATQLPALIQSQNCSTLYLAELKQKTFKPGKSFKTWPCIDTSVIIINEIGAPPEADAHKSMMRAKLFQFHENYRPAYYGTWRKTSKNISGRHPLRKDVELLDYEVESDEEWEEEEPGESISHSEGENDDEPEEGGGGGDDDDEDGFFVPHGYLSEDEGCREEGEHMSPSKLKEYQLAKARYWETEMNNKKCDVLRPVCITLSWIKSTQASRHLVDKLDDFKLELFEATPISVFTLIKDKMLNKKDKEGSKRLSDVKKSHKRKNFMPVPDTALPDLIRLVHGNKYSIQKLVREFREFSRLQDLAAQPLSDQPLVQPLREQPSRMT